MKAGTVALIGRPNVGKSTLVNNIVGQKVAITSPKPQTTRFPINALFEDEREKIIFVDTPGIFGKAKDFLAKKINEKTFQAINEEIDLVIYMIDHTRKRDFEEAKVIGIVRKINKPKILVINKIDLQDKTFLPQYKFLEDEIPYVFQISALKKLHFKPIMQKIFELLPEEKPTLRVPGTLRVNEMMENKAGYPLLNMDSKTFIAERSEEHTSE